MRFDSDLLVLFAARGVRLLGFGALPVVLTSYLKARGLPEAQIGLLLSLALLGDAGLSLLISGVADVFGRKRLLIWSTSLIALAGVGFALSQDAFWLIVCAIIGTISPNGNEVGPFQALEQACVSQLIPAARRARVFGWYAMTGSLSAALGAVLAGGLIEIQKQRGIVAIVAQQQVFFGYAAISLVLLLIFTRLSGRVETQSFGSSTVIKPVPSADSKRIMLHLSSLFALDSFGSALVMQSLIALYLENRFAVGAGTLGAIFATTNIVAALSTPLAGWFAERFGLVNTMVWTHIPANVFLMLFPFAPTLELTIVLLVARFCLSQMDVPARTALVMNVVPENQRSFAAGMTQQGKLIGTSLGPVLSGLLSNAGFLVVPFVLGGGLKIVYDLAIYAGFKRLEDLPPP
jgi:MFS family permease